ncbi:MAG: NAD(P)H-dependent oxidoreductase [Methanomicrobiales archaeon]|jgi:multimeric flavodoxin WrbA|nr:NAD(P)H-dependent oxidoreductase [Methanomicrobiales archaeon]
MKIGIVHASPKHGKNSTESFAHVLANMLPEHEISHLRVKDARWNQKEESHLVECDALVLCFPLYIDAVPSHFLFVLQEWEIIFKEMHENKPKIYVIVNCGFFEGEHTRVVFEILKNWCHKAKLEWGMGLGIGAGPMFAQAHAGDLNQRPNAVLAEKIRTMADVIDQLETADTIYISPNFPKFFYIHMGNLGWVLQAKKNGLRKKDLHVKP